MRHNSGREQPIGRLIRAGLCDVFRVAAGARLECTVDMEFEKLEETGQPLVVYGRPGCPGLRPVLNLLDKAGVAYEYVDVRQDAEAAARLRSLAGGHESVPTIIMPDGRALVEPGTLGLRRALQEAGLGNEALESPAAAVQAGLSNRVYWVMALIALAITIAIWLTR